MDHSDKEKDIANEILHSRASDHEWDVISNILDIFNLDQVDENYDDEDDNDPIPLRNLITKNFLENHYDEILEKLFSRNEYHDHLNHMVLGALIIRERARMPEKLKERILHTISWDAELKWRWKNIDKVKQKDFLEERKNLIESFRQAILNYPSNKT